ncbi:hypothetical protein [Geomonas subterranea]|uniref:Uncharacterized protein n=1 Tax=Geomonas subterranea TaxID=2847989 RepID=A0ABX8LLR3_9BACT|nr:MULTISPECIES: hypothetical protein [Geomonas]QXE92827.1 hypothetical protein KP001_10035 [Geomonas subterranea]QXM09069.1 hypothetical protein KP002_19240 [Geomonas subterranea]
MFTGLVGGTGMVLFAGEGVQLMADAIRLEDVQVRRIGVHLLVQGKPAKKQNH